MNGAVAQRPGRRRVAARTAVLVTGASSPAVADPWSDAARAIVRVPPRASVLPTEVAAYFESLGCSVPQPAPDPFLPSKPENAIRGRYARAGQADHAIVCSIDGRSRIEVAWGGRAVCPAFAAFEPHDDDLQDIGGGTIGNSRSIRPVLQRDIDRYRRWFGGARPGDRSHQGIDDDFKGTGSIVFYCSGGRWLGLQGAD